MEVTPVTLEGRQVRLEPLLAAHEEALIAAASDGELWNSTVTIVPTRATMAAYIEAALEAQTQGSELPFVIIRKRGTGVPPVSQAQEPSDEIVGTTRFYDIVRADRRVASATRGCRRALNAPQSTRKVSCYCSRTLSRTGVVSGSS